MRWKTVLVLLVLILAACATDLDGASRSISAPVSVTDSPVADGPVTVNSVTISSVRVSGSRAVEFAGRSTLPDGAAIGTQLYGDWGGAGVVAGRPDGYRAGWPVGDSHRCGAHWRCCTP